MRKQKITEDRFIGELSDSTLMDGVRQGDERAFETLFRRYYRQVFAVAYRLVGSHDEAEDLVQETFVRLHRHPVTNGTALNLGGWLYRVVTNLGYNALRTRSRQDMRQQRAESLAEGEMPILANRDDPVEALDRREDRRTVRLALAQLPEREQALLVLRSQGLSYAEVAAVLGVAPGSIGTMLARAESDLKKEYLALLEGGQHR